MLKRFKIILFSYRIFSKLLHNAFYKLLKITIMTIFIKLPRMFNKQISYEISDVYTMAVTFLVTYYATKLLQDAYVHIKNKRNLRKQRLKMLANPNIQAGGLNEQLYEAIVDSTPVNDNELFNAVLECIRDNQTYNVLNERLKKIVFAKVGALIRHESIRMTPNLFRVIAKVEYNRNPSILLKAGNLLVSTNNQSVLKARIVTTFAVAVFAKLTALVGYSILILLLVFQETSYVPCDRYFEKLPTDSKTIDVIVEKDTRSLLITGNDDARQVEIYVPEREIVESTRGTVKTYIRKYKRSPKKVREVKFSDFRKNDPVLSKFDQDRGEIDEPLVPEKQDRFFRDFDVADF